MLILQHIYLKFDVVNDRQFYNLPITTRCQPSIVNIQLEFFDEFLLYSSLYWSKHVVSRYRHVDHMCMIIKLADEFEASSLLNTLIIQPGILTFSTFLVLAIEIESSNLRDEILQNKINFYLYPSGHTCTHDDSIKGIVKELFFKYAKLKT